MTPRLRPGVRRERNPWARAGYGDSMSLPLKSACPLLLVSLVLLVGSPVCAHEGADEEPAAPPPAPKTAEPEKKAPETKAPEVDERPGRWLKQMDANGDGKLARAETRGAMKRFFNRNDANQDGVLDAAELAALSKRLAGGKRSPARQRGTPTTKQLLASAPKDIRVVADIAYRTGESKAWRLDLFMPKAKADAARPALVFVHGGGWKQGDKRSGTFLRGAMEYAQKGYVCISVNYRLIDEAPMPASIEDVKCAVRWLRAHAAAYGVDPKRVGAYGNSAGAHLVLMLGLVGKKAGLEGDGPYQDQSSLVQAVCASAPPTDFTLFAGSSTRRVGKGSLFAGTPEDLYHRMKQASPLTYVRKGVPPLLLIHGTADTTVRVEHSDVFVKALKDAGATNVTLMRIKGAPHGVFNKHRAETHPAMETFFARTLRSGK